MQYRKKREKLMIFLQNRKNVLLLQQHAYPASHKNSALRVSFLFYILMETKTNKIPYPKHLISFTDQINLLKQRGMVFGNEPKALHLLQNISYYRLSGYWYPLLADKQQHIFKPGSTFETAYNIYKFDSELRKLIIAEIEKIEVAVRTQTAYILSSQYGAYWFEDSSLFSSPVRHAKLLSKIDEEYSRSDEEFIKAFKTKYSNHFPPSWITMEITSFGTLSILYENLLPGKTKRSIAAYFGLADKVFASWLHSVVYVRNICAHHSRLWNKTLSIRPLMPRSPRNTFIKLPANGTPQIYFVLSMIIYLLNTINPNHSFVSRFKDLLNRYPSIDIHAMGFPDDWKNGSLWKD